MADSPLEKQSSSPLPKWMTRYNPPAQKMLVYRGGRYGGSLTGMEKRLPDETGEGRSPDGGPLALLNLDLKDDWTTAVLRAWAAVTEVLGFYQERIINEGYIRTATEHRSIVELVRAIGYERRPGVAASTHLAFTLLSGPGATGGPVTIPKGTGVESTPAPGQDPVIFETSEDLVALPEWDTIKLQPDHAEDIYLPPGTFSARLIGVDPGLRPGDLILITSNLSQSTECRWWLASIQKVQPFPDRGYTIVTWQIQSGAEPPASGAPHSKLYLLQTPAAPWSYSHGGLYRADKPASPGSPEFAPSAPGLANVTVYAVVENARGEAFCGTDQGLYRLAADGQGWKPVTTGLSGRGIHALTKNDQGQLYAGSEEGHIFSSKDNGNTWTAVSGESVVLPATGLSKLLTKSKAPLPKTVVRALATYKHGSTRYLVAGTDVGLFRSSDDGKTFETFSHDLPNTDKKTGLGTVPVWALATIPAQAPVPPPAPPSHKDSPTPSPQDGFPVAPGFQSEEVLYAATDAGVFRIHEPLDFSRPGGKPWAITLILAFGPAVVLGLLLLLRPVLCPKPSLLSEGGFDGCQIYGVIYALIESLSSRIGEMAKIIPPLGILNKFPLLLLVIWILGVLLLSIVITRIARQLKQGSEGLVAQSPVSSLGQPVHGLLVDQEGRLWAGKKGSESAPSDGGPPEPPARLPVYDKALYRSGQVAQGIPLSAWNKKWLQWLKPSRENLTAILLALRPGLKSVSYEFVLGWEAVPLGRNTDTRAKNTDIRSLGIDAGGAILAGTQDGTFLSSTDKGKTWQATLISNRDNPEGERAFGLQSITSICASDRSYFVAGVPGFSPFEMQWYPSQLAKYQIDLDRVYPDLKPDQGFVILKDKSNASLYTTAGVEVVDSPDVRPGKLTRLTLSPSGPAALASKECDPAQLPLGKLDRASLQVLAQSRPVKLYSPELVTGSKLEIDRVLTSLKIGKKLVLSGKRVRARIVPAKDYPQDWPPAGLHLDRTYPVISVQGNDGQQEWILQADDNTKVPVRLLPDQIGLLVSDDGLRVEFLTPRETYQVIARQDPDKTGPGHWRLVTRSGSVGTVPVRTLDQLQLENATDTDESQSELIEITGCKFDQVLRMTELTVAPALANFYDATSVTIYGNIVQATHGQQVPDESLGGSDGLGINNSFVLKQSPLTYVRSTRGSDAESTLGISINGVKWKYKHHLYGSTRDERVYMVRQDANDNSTVIFGDGQQGSGIPRGTREIIATYRQGLGEAGNVPPGSLRQIKTSLPGVKGVTNPLPAEGGAGADKPEDVRQLAPLSVEDFDRIVSLRDYADFARDYPGIRKARAIRGDRDGQDTTQDGTRPVRLYIALADGAVPDKQDSLFADLQKAIYASRATSVPPVHIESYAPVLFNVEVTLYFDPEQVRQSADIGTEARKVLEETFDFAHRDFTQAVYLSEIVAPIQKIRGVAAVQVDRLYRFDLHNPTAPPEQRPDKLEPRQPQEILIINKASGIKLRLEKAL